MKNILQIFLITFYSLGTIFLPIGNFSVIGDLPKMYDHCKATEDKDLIDLHELESNLVYFATSLSANKVVLERLTRYERIKQYVEDTELLNDVIVETRQAIEMTNIYKDINNGTRQLLSTMINNRLNNMMKFLTSITLVMAIPTIISGIYGMNVNANFFNLKSYA